ncbi:MAG TPA: hypothetical protein ENK43_17695 [Planctomycetes bacterium]|nr:hypothetical protein [Planctomycetota bacterium]
MKLISLELSHWRRFRGGPHRVTFGERGTLVHGPNEAGKSTLFQALRHALFDRPSGTADWLKGLPSYGSSATPRVRLEFELDGRHLAVEKEFGGKGSTTLEQIGEGGSQVLSEGMEAVGQLVDLLGAELGRGPLKRDHWGAFQWLFMLQDPTMRGIPKVRGAALEALGMDGAATSDLFEQVARRVADEINDKFTAKRTGFKKNSEIPRLEEELDDLRARREEYLRERADLAESARRYEEIREELPRLKEAVEKATEECERDVKALGEREAEDRDLPRLEADLKQAEEALRSAEESLAARRLLEKRIEELEGELETARREEIDAAAAWKSLEAEGRQLAEERERLLSRSHELETNLKDMRPCLETCKARARADLLTEKLVQIAEMSRAIEAEREALAGPHPTAADMERIRGLAVKIDVARAADPRLLITCDDAALDVLVDGVPMEAGEGRAHDEVLVRIPGHEGGVRIRTADAGPALSELEAELQRQLSAHGAASLEELATHLERLRQAERRLGALEGERKGLLADATVTDLEAELKRLREFLDGREPVPKERISELEAAVRSAESELEKLQARLRDVDKRREAWQLAETDGRTALLEVQNRRMSWEATRKEAARQLDDERDRVGSTARLMRRCEEERERLQRKRKDFEKKRDESKSRRLAADNALATSKRRLKDARERLQRAREDVASLTDRLDRLAASGLGTRLDEVERRIDERRKRLAVLKRRAEATLRLESVMTEVRKETFAAVTGPVRTKAADFLSFVTTGRYEDMELGDDLHPAALSGPHQTLERFEDGSEGLRELANAMLRLAVAVTLCEEAPQALVLDDPCAAVSPARTRRFVELLNRLMAEHPLQIVILTHRPEEFDGLDAVSVDVQRDLVDPNAADSREETGTSS